MSVTHRAICLLALTATIATACAQPKGLERPPVSLVPAPTGFEQTDGTVTLTSETRVDIEPQFLEGTQSQLEWLRETTGLPWELVDDSKAAADRSRQPALTITASPEVPIEGYRLETSAAGVRIEASSDAGVFYAFQTLRQLLPAGIDPATPARTDADWQLPLVTIEDAPRFAYRGLHLDVGRHFFDVAFVKTMLDTMSSLKFNRFHWHLTEDQGWRVQIDAFPLLTEIGAWRNETVLPGQLDPYRGDGKRYGGFYTKDEIREVVAYARERHIEVIPEIEMPGHATAALAAYPEFGCTDQAPSVSTTWGVHDTIFCPKEATFSFLTTVLDEVIELFPSTLIHIGADEVPKRQWKESAEAQAVMRREGLADEDELQSYFIRRIEQHLNKRGRRLIGWDEILEGGLAPDATVMSWRTPQSAIAATKLGHDVIRTPNEYAYFDFYQGDHEQEPLAMDWAQRDITLETVYSFEPIPSDLNSAEAAHILGAQANLWTEYIATPEHAEYMLYPRALALAEVVWSAAERRDWDNFVSRLPEALSRLEASDVDFRWPSEVLGMK